MIRCFAVDPDEFAILAMLCLSFFGELNLRGGGSEHCHVPGRTGSQKKTRDQRGDPEKITKIENNLPGVLSIESGCYRESLKRRAECQVGQLRPFSFNLSGSYPFYVIPLPPRRATHIPVL